VLSWLTQGFGDGEPMRLKAWVASESPSRLTHPHLDVLASVTRAIHQECPLGIEYHSISSGQSEREIVPFALIDNGLRWHVRAFDRKSQEFRDFVITRIKRPVRAQGECQWHLTRPATRTSSGPGFWSWTWSPIPTSRTLKSPRWTTAWSGAC
jgi:predicted DNA-binding transcriptional regulator YafY